MCTIRRQRDVILASTRQREASINRTPCDLPLLRHGGSAPAALLFRPRSILMALAGGQLVGEGDFGFVWMVAVEARLRALVSFKLRHIRHRQRRALDNACESPNP